MALILLGSKRLATFWTPKGINTMRHQNSVLHGVLKHIPWSRFDRLVEEHGADKHVRRLTTKSQLVALLYGQLSSASSLREIEAGLKSHEAKIYHLGAKPARRSTLADANALRPSAIFSDLFATLVGLAHPGLRRKTRDAIRMIDSSGLKLSSLSRSWAKFSTGVYGAKLHVVYDPDADCPLYFATSAANVNDITQAKTIPIEAGATYVFDLGYYDYGWWAALDAANCRIVTRLKRNTPLREVTERRVSKRETAILGDRTGRLPVKMTYRNKNPFQKPVREITVRMQSGKILRIATNDLESSAREIADLYKRRWQVELFFRWVKQTLKIKRFLGTSENAVRIQIAAALIAFLLLRMAQTCQQAITTALTFTRLIRANLLHKRPIDRLLDPSPPPSHNPDQLALAFL
jgi:IS4 transposase